MPQRQASKRLQKAFNQTVSYRSGDIGEKLFDSLNLLAINNQLVTRPGIKRFTPDTFATAPQSLSFYLNNSGTRKIVSKAGTSMFAATTDGVFTPIKTGLTSTTVHDAVTFNGRHIIAIGSDGLFSWDGTTFTTLGIAAPTAPTIAADDGTGTLADKNYVVAITYEATGIGFESNIGVASNEITTAGGDDSLDVTSIPVSTHPLVDKKNIYLKNLTDTGAYLFVGQIDNAVTTFNIAENPAATADSPPVGKDPPLAGGGKYLAIFNRQLIVAGNPSFPNDVFFSNTEEPDGFSTSNQNISAQGDGVVTGVAVGFRAGNELDQYLAVFKRRSTTIYYENLDGSSSTTFIPGVGAESHKNIIAKDGNIYFLSAAGWRVISNGRLVDNTLAKGDIDDIFKLNGFTYGVNKQQLANSFGVFYQELDSYMTWVAEGSSTTFDKCYNYHMDLDGFMPLQVSGTCACMGEDADGNETVYIGSGDRFIYKYSMRNTCVDEQAGEGFTLDVDQVDVGVVGDDLSRAISVFVLFNWLPEDDFDASYNFRDYTVKAISENTVEKSEVVVKAFINFSRTTAFDNIYSFYRQEGFQLDVSRLDIDVLGDDRSQIKMTHDLNLCGENILLGVFQSVEEARLQLIAHQLNYSKNGNRNV